MSEFAKSIIDKIKKAHLKPIPKWVFLLRRSVVWGSFGLSVLFGSMAVSIILFQIKDMDYEVYREMGSSLTGFVLLALPYFWLVLLIGFLALAYYHLRHTKSGYRHNVFAIIGLSLVVSVLLGASLYATGISENLEKVFRRIPNYERLHFGKRMLWNNPEQGFLAGTIIHMGDGRIILLRDLEQGSWRVDIEKAKMRREFEMERGVRVRLTGTATGDYEFKAFNIAPWLRPMNPPPIFRRMELQK
ncbi:hypothetical protein JW752_03050 [Candidatus Peregrinibacteria bacterium]|nr:hypothetical protein [Candidatus Peregrinibacteria bacterium]